MSLLNTILGKLGLGRAEAAPRAPSTAPPTPHTPPTTAPTPHAPPLAAPRSPMATVDVVARRSR